MASIRATTNRSRQRFGDTGKKVAASVAPSARYARAMSESFPTEVGRVLVFQAHPDDEVFTTAAAMLAVVAAGGTVRLLVASGGELGEQMADSTLDEETARRLRAARLTESCRILGVEWEPLTEP